MERDVKSAVTQSSLHNNPYTREQTTTIQKKKKDSKKKVHDGSGENFSIK